VPRVSVEQLCGRGRLDVDGRQRVGDHVVEVASNAQALVLGSSLGVLLAGAFRQLEPLPEQREVGVSGAVDVGDQEGDRDQEGVPERLEHRGPAAGEAVGQHDRGDGGDGGDDLRPRAPPQRDGVEGDGRRDDGGGARCGLEVQQDERRRAREGEGCGGRAAPPEE
jgi:hypothetical protein